MFNYFILFKKTNQNYGLISLAASEKICIFCDFGELTFQKKIELGMKETTEFLFH